MKKSTLFILFLLGITQNILSQSATGTITQVPCNNDGIYSITTTGLTLPLTYTYSVNGTTIVHSNINSTTDQLTNLAMNNNGYISCEVTNGTYTVWAQNNYTPPFQFTTNGNSPTCPATMGTVTATQFSGTPGPFTYTWTNNQTLTTYSGNNANVPIGSYSLEITDQTTGCNLHLTDTAAYIYQVSSITATTSSTPASCTNGTATAVASGGVSPYSYQWNTGATSSSINGLSQGAYTVNITDNIGCQLNFTTVYVSQNPYVSVNTTVTNATCIQSDGSAIAFGSGGTSPYTYSWSNGQMGSNATNLIGSNYYTVMATDANGCVGQGGAYINSSTPITVTYSSINSQCTAGTGSITLSVSGGVPPYDFAWNTTQTTNSATLSNLSPGSYSFQVTDANGCVRTGSAVVNPISSINASATGSTVQCPTTTGSAMVNINGSNPPFNFLWSNGATTQQISSAALGSYSCVITDALGCSVTKSTTISAVSPINVAVSTAPVTCQFNSDGSVTATVSGGTPPYTYSYSNGASTSNSSGLGVGNYSLTVTDANGCSTYKFFVISNSNSNNACYCTISGHVYVDGNADCIYDSGENGIENIMIHCSGIGYTFTDANGYYSFQVPTGTYTISEQVNAYYPLAACQSNSNSVNVVAASGCNMTVDLGNDVSTIHDLKIVTINSTTPPIPGNNYQQKVIVKNEGTVSESVIQLGYEQDSQLPFVNSSSPSFTQPNSTTYPLYYTIQSGFPTLVPNGNSVMLLNYTTPTDIPLGTSLTFYDSVAHVGPIEDNWILDYTPWNNVNTYQTTVIGSYDPNYKEVSPKGIGAPGYIASTTTEFDYTIHFQNEGSYYAQNIYITDQLDSDLDWTTLKPGYSDYTYTTTVSETGLVTFTFNNIHLPWKADFGDAMSSGVINYSISRKTTNPQGTEFTNSANIFFDYNPPITTNTTLNTLNDLIAGTEENKPVKVNNEEISVELFPVPASDNLTIRVNNISKNEEASISIIDIMGNTVLTNKLKLEEGSNSVTHNISKLAKGTYLTKIQFSDGSNIVKKIIVN